MKLCILLLLFIITPLSSVVYNVDTIAGTGADGMTSGRATSAKLKKPRSIWQFNDIFYVVENSGNFVRKFSGANNIISTFAGVYETGSGSFDGDGGQATSANLKYPISVATDSSGRVYITDFNNNRVRRVATNGIISTLTGDGAPASDGSGGAATSASVWAPHGIWVNSNGLVYVTEFRAYRIRTINGNIISNYAGVVAADGAFFGHDVPISSAKFDFVERIVGDTSGAVYVSDSGNNRVRQIDNGRIYTVAGDGGEGQGGNNVVASSADVFYPRGVSVDGANGDLFIVDAKNHRVRWLVQASQRLFTIAGTGTASSNPTADNGDGGKATSCTFDTPDGIYGAPSGELYVADPSNFKVRILWSVSPTSQPSGQPAGSPTTQPSRQPTGQPSRQPSRQPTSQPSKQPFSLPTSLPSNQPTSQPSIPTSQPTGIPTQPSGQPTTQPTSQPSRQPTGQPTRQPTSQPSRQPSTQPTGRPSCQPFAKPSSIPSSQPSSDPTRQPSVQPNTKPSSQPTSDPTRQPTSQPSTQPSRQPVGRPSGQPSMQPSSQPTRQPINRPSTQPSRQPTSQPSSMPTQQPSGSPSIQPSVTPSGQPSSQPSGQPSRQPISRPSTQPSRQPTFQPSSMPTQQPSGSPSIQPSVTPSCQPSSQPSSQPTNQPSNQPTAQPSLQPYSHPSSKPSRQPSSRPSAQPSSQPSASPTNQPSAQPSNQPSIQPTNQPSSQPTRQPTSKPSSQPSIRPSKQPVSAPSTQPTSQPSGSPSYQPSRQPSMQPTIQPTSQPSSHPTSQPSISPSSQPSRKPSRQPSSQPSSSPTVQPSGCPSSQPSRQPTGQPSRQPTAQPSTQPSRQPTSQPSRSPTSVPTTQPSKEPSSQPSSHPSHQPTSSPTRQPSDQPSSQPTCMPSSHPTMQPSVTPSNQPSIQPSLQPSVTPSGQPSGTPSQNPSAQPSVQPTRQPVVQPSSQPSSEPSKQPTSQPSTTPSTQPSTHPSRVPSSQPSASPSVQPSSQPSRLPTSQPSIQPSCVPTNQPSAQPSSCPTSQPSGLPSQQPSNSPTRQPTDQPSFQPTLQPTRRPSSQPSESPSGQPTHHPSSQPTQQPSRYPSAQPSGQPSAAPSMQPSVHPSSSPSTQPTATPSTQPSSSPTNQPSIQPSAKPSSQPTTDPSVQPTNIPSGQPTCQPSSQPTLRPFGVPTSQPSSTPSVHPSCQPSTIPSTQPSSVPSLLPTSQPASHPTSQPSRQPTSRPTGQPISHPTSQPSRQPSRVPTSQPSDQPSAIPTKQPSSQPSSRPSHTPQPSFAPTPIALGHLPDSQKSLSVIDVSGDGNAAHSFKGQFKIVLVFGQTAIVGGDGFSDVLLRRNTNETLFVAFGSRQPAATISLQREVYGVSYSVQNAAVSYDYSGRSVSNAGDINGDGHDDLIIGVPYAAKCYVLFGTANGFVNMTDGFTIYGAQLSDLTGWSVSSAGDMNNDTFADFLVGAPNSASSAGTVYLFLGMNFGFTDIYLDNYNPKDVVALHGINILDNLGVSVSSAGDVNGDGFDDIIVGALTASSLSNGAAYVLFGRPTDKLIKINPDFSLRNMSLSSGVAFRGGIYQWAGHSVSGAGDVNGDGFDDVLIGTFPQRASLPTVTYIVFGKATGWTSLNLRSLTSAQGVVISGGGVIVSGVGDVDGDGFDDVSMVQLNYFSGAGYQLQTRLHFVAKPSHMPTRAPTCLPTTSPSKAPLSTLGSTSHPTVANTLIPISRPPSAMPTLRPTSPTQEPSVGASQPTSRPSVQPSHPTTSPTSVAPTFYPTYTATIEPSEEPSTVPTPTPTVQPSIAPTPAPTYSPSVAPRKSRSPTCKPSATPTITFSPSATPSVVVYVTIPVLTANTNTTTPDSQHVVQVSRTEDNTNYILNVSGIVVISGTGGADMFTVLPNHNATYIVHSFNAALDVISLESFPQFVSFSDVNMTKGSVIIHLPQQQTLRLLNLNPADMTASHFLFATTRSSEGTRAKDKGTSTMVLAIAATLIGCGFLVAVAYYGRMLYAEVTKKHYVSPIITTTQQLGPRQNKSVELSHMERLKRKQIYLFAIHTEVPSSSSSGSDSAHGSDSATHSSQRSRLYNTGSDNSLLSRRTGTEEKYNDDPYGSGHFDLEAQLHSALWRDKVDAQLPLIYDQQGCPHSRYSVMSSSEDSHSRDSDASSVEYDYYVRRPEDCAPECTQSPMKSIKSGSVRSEDYVECNAHIPDVPGLTTPLPGPQKYESKSKAAALSLNDSNVHHRPMVMDSQMPRSLPPLEVLFSHPLISIPYESSASVARQPAQSLSLSLNLDAMPSVTADVDKRRDDSTQAAAQRTKSRGDRAAESSGEKRPFKPSIISALKLPDYLLTENKSHLIEAETLSPTKQPPTAALAAITEESNNHLPRLIKQRKLTKYPKQPKPHRKLKQTVDISSGDLDAEIEFIATEQQQPPSRAHSAAAELAAETSIKQYTASTAIPLPGENPSTDCLDLDAEIEYNDMSIPVGNK